MHHFSPPTEKELEIFTTWYTTGGGTLISFVVRFKGEDRQSFNAVQLIPEDGSRLISNKDEIRSLYEIHF